MKPQEFPNRFPKRKRNTINKNKSSRLPFSDPNSVFVAAINANRAFFLC